MRVLTAAARRIAGEELVPRWSSALPGPAPGRLPQTSRDGAAAVYVPSCLNRMMGPPGDSTWLPEALVTVSARAGMPVWIPDDVAGVCCSMPWSSKGFQDGHAVMASRFAESLRRWSGDGALPVVIDAASCTHGAATEVDGLDGIEVLDGVTWAARLLPNLTVPKPVATATVHPTCSTRHLGLAEDLQSVAAALAETVHVPVVATCCGMAGDRGLLHPELTQAATRDEAAEVTAADFTAHVSANRTCELALEQATGRPYEHVIALLERASRP
jgi:D-lactate dehydrogenase